MSAAKKKVNLLLRESFEYTTLGKVLAWSLSAGRVIVILTELVVIIAFLSRFWLDRTLTDLNEQNASKKKQIEAASKFESDFRQTQQQLAAYQKLISVPAEAAERVAEVTSFLPSGVTLASISMSEDKITLTGNALSEQGLAGFLQALQISKKLKDSKLTSLSLTQEGQQSLVFTVNTTLATKRALPKKGKDEEATEEKL